MQELIVIKAGLFGSIFGFIGDKGLEAVISLLIIALGFIAKKYLLPLLKTELARSTAHHLLVIADDVTDYFAGRYPDAHWSVWLDKAIDKIIEVTGVGEDTAERVARACVNRKVDRLISKTEAKLRGTS